MGFFDMIFEMAEKVAEQAYTAQRTYDRASAERRKTETEIGKDRYRGDDSLTEFDIPEGIVKIGSGAFRDCKNLKRVSFPSTLRYIGGNAFTNCVMLTEVVVPEGVTFIDNGAFSDCRSLVSAVLPQSLQRINGGLFYGCRSLEHVVMPRTVTGGFSNVFPSCESLTSFRIPYGADELGAFTFQYCYSLESLKIPDTVKYIGHRSMSNCGKLREIYIPDSVTKMACLHTFYNCGSLTKVRLPLGIGFRDILNDHTEDQAALCFANCPELHTVEMCGREFHIDTMNDSELMLIRAELAADGNDRALELISGKFPEVLRAVTDHGRVELAGKLLACLTPDMIPPEDLLAAIDHAAELGSHEIYVMLVHFRSDTDSGEISTGDRFRL